MQQPLLQGDIMFERFLQARLPTWEALMRELGACTYAGKTLSPQELLHELFLYGGPDVGILDARKRMKRLSNIKQLRAKRGSQLAAVYLYGKILYQLIVGQKCILRLVTSGAAWLGSVTAPGGVSTRSSKHDLMLSLHAQ
jgi:hypothetical protein